MGASVNPTPAMHLNVDPNVIASMTDKRDACPENVGAISGDAAKQFREEKIGQIGSTPSPLG